MYCNTARLQNRNDRSTAARDWRGMALPDIGTGRPGRQLRQSTAAAGGAHCLTGIDAGADS